MDADDQRSSVDPSEQRGGTTPGAQEAAEKGPWAAKAADGVVPAELGGSDYLRYPGATRARFEVHYVLLNLDTSERLVVKAGVDEAEPTLPTVVGLWPGANWMERGPPIW